MTRSRRNNNPGNIRATKWSLSLPGVISQDRGGMVIFSDWAFGLSAMFRLLRGGAYRDLTIAEGIARYAPKSENDTAAYLAFVTQETGLHGHEYLRDLLPWEMCSLVGAMVRMEGWE